MHVSSRAVHAPMHPAPHPRPTTVAQLLQAAYNAALPADSNHCAGRLLVSTRSWGSLTLAASRHRCSRVLEWLWASLQKDGLPGGPHPLAVLVAAFTWLRHTRPPGALGDPSLGCRLLALIMEWTAGHAYGHACAHPVHHRALVYIHGLQLLRECWPPLARMLRTLRLGRWVPGLSSSIHSVLENSHPDPGPQQRRAATYVQDFDLFLDIDWGPGDDDDDSSDSAAEPGPREDGGGEDLSKDRTDEDVGAAEGSSRQCDEKDGGGPPGGGAAWAWTQAVTSFFARGGH